jgi:hypothetical protein
MANWIQDFGGPLIIPSGSAPVSIPENYIAIYTSGSDGFVYYQTSNSSPIKLG